MKNPFLMILVFFLFVISENCFSQEADWELRKNEDGIRVYTRKKEDSKAIEFKAVTSINAPVSNLIRILKDVEAYHLWMADLKIARKLKSISENEWFTYYIASVPWPLENRDVIFFVQLFNINGKTILSLKSKADFVPKNKDYIRINFAEGKWIFTPEGENKTTVFYQFYADPEINVPIWITNIFIVKGPFDTLKNLKKIALDMKYNK